MSEQNIQILNQRVVNSMNKWSNAFFRLLLPSKLGAKATIKQIEDEGAKVLSVGMYNGKRIGTVEAIPYDGSTYEGHTIGDESKSTASLWLYEASFPDGFTSQKEKDFLISLGYIFKCYTCRGQGRVTCKTCGGKVQWRTQKFDGTIVEHTCSCGDGKQDCGTCTGFGQMLKVIRVTTEYTFHEERDKEYSGNLPDVLLIKSSGNSVFKHIIDFGKRVISEVIGGFAPNEFNKLMLDAQSEFKEEVSNKIANQMVNPKILHNMIDNYFKKVPNLVVANKRLEVEFIPVRMKCGVTDVPVQKVTYDYKEKAYVLYVYGNDGKIWVEGKQPIEITWKLLVTIGIILAVVFIIIFTQF